MVASVGSIRLFVLGLLSAAKGPRSLHVYNQGACVDNLVDMVDWLLREFCVVLFGQISPGYGICTSRISM